VNDIVGFTKKASAIDENTLSRLGDIIILMLKHS